MLILPVKAVQNCLASFKIYNTFFKSLFLLELNWFNKLVWVMFTTAITGVLGTDLAFWIFLSGNLSPEILRNPFNLQEHLINYILLFIDLFINDIPIRLLHCIYPMGYAIVYILFTVILWASNFTSAVYPTLNWEINPLSSTLLSLGVIFIAVPLLHVFHFGLYHLRSWLARHLLDRSTTAPTINNDVQMNDASHKL